MNSFIDPGEYVESLDGQHYIVLTGTNDTRVMHIVYKTLELFKDMGMPDSQFLHERKKLVTDESYFNFWCRDIPNWCPEVAYFIKKND
jgi:hypothetical protein